MGLCVMGVRVRVFKRVRGPQPPTSLEYAPATVSEFSRPNVTLPRESRGNQKCARQPLEPSSVRPCHGF